MLSASIDGITVAEKVVEQTGVIGEKLELSYYEVVDGETVYGYNDGVKIAAFRLANANHKFGPYTAPSVTYGNNPYSSACVYLSRSK